MSRPTPAKSKAVSISKNAKNSGESPFHGRIGRLGEAIANADLSALVVSNPKDVAYLTGFHGGDSYLIVPAEAWRSSHQALLVSDFRYQEELEPVSQAGLARVVIRSKSMVETVAELLGPASGSGSSASNGSAAGKVKGRSAGGSGLAAGAESAGFGADDRFGIQAEFMPVAEKSAFAKRVGVKRLTDTTGLVMALRVVKDAGEIELIRKAVKIQEAALKALMPRLKAGQSELEIAAQLEMEMKSRGSTEPGFESIVAAGANGSLPHYRPGSKKLAKNSALLIDWGAVYGGYHSDMTRVVCLGKWPKKVEEIYRVVLEAHEKSAAALAPGKTGKEIDAVARKVIVEAGYGDSFGHGLGHGIGFNGHEEPRLSNMASGAPLQPGMVVTIEPGIYLPGIGGVRIEDDYVITEGGSKNLCTLPKSLEWGTL